MRQMLIYPRRAWVISHLGAEQARTLSVSRFLRQALSANGGAVRTRRSWSNPRPGRKGSYLWPKVALSTTLGQKKTPWRVRGDFHHRNRRASERFTALW